MAYLTYTRFFFTPIFLCICLLRMGALATFHALILVGVGIGKILIDLCVRNIFHKKFTWSGNMLVSGWLSVSLRYYNGLSAVIDWKVHLEKLELNDT